MKRVMSGLFMQAILSIVLLLLAGWTGDWRAAVAGALFILAICSWNVAALGRLSAGRREKEEKKQMRPTPKEEMKDAETQGRSEEEVWAQTEAEGEWIKRMLSHNMRMPMAIITGYGDLLKTGEYQNRQEELEYIQKICGNIDYLNRLLGVVLDTGRQNREAQKEYFDVLGCIREVAEYVKTMARRAGIVIAVNSSKQEILLYGDRIQMMRAFYNLFENSLKYMKRGGTIYVTAEETEEGILMVYKDDGVGMDAQEAEWITQPGYRGSNAQENNNAGGDGLGMYLVKRIVEGHGGSLRVKSGSGKGMGIYMTFRKNL